MIHFLFSLSSLVNDDENMFKCGASVAPVVDWRLYDTYYTERVMDTPENNFQGKCSNLLHMTQTTSNTHVSNVFSKLFHMKINLHCLK